MSGWNLIQLITVLLCFLTLYVNAKHNDLCDNDSDCSRKDNEICHIIQYCKKGLCRCRTGYWVKFSSLSTTCIKNVPDGDTCDSKKDLQCAFHHRCSKCPEDKTNVNAKTICYAGGAPNVFAVKALTVIVASSIVSYVSN